MILPRLYPAFGRVPGRLTAGGFNRHVGGTGEELEDQDRRSPAWLASEARPGWLQLRRLERRGRQRKGGKPKVRTKVIATAMTDHVRPTAAPVTGPLGSSGERPAWRRHHRVRLPARPSRAPRLLGTGDHRVEPRRAGIERGSSPPSVPVSTQTSGSGAHSGRGHHSCGAGHSGGESHGWRKGRRPTRRHLDTWRQARGRRRQRRRPPRRRPRWRACQPPAGQLGSAAAGADLPRGRGHEGGASTAAPTQAAVTRAAGARLDAMTSAVPSPLLLPRARRRGRRPLRLPGDCPIGPGRSQAGPRSRSRPEVLLAACFGFFAFQLRSGHDPALGARPGQPAAARPSGRSSTTASSAAWSRARTRRDHAVDQRGTGSTSTVAPAPAPAPATTSTS